MTNHSQTQFSANQKRHARFHCPQTPYHIISKTRRGEFFLVPKDNIASLCAGVMGKAQLHWSNMKIYGLAFMSNHLHLMVQGDSRHISAFVGFIKREISRRLGQLYSIEGSIWAGRFISTALPTPESQVACLRYILSQGVKENLVAHPCQWPGLHCASALLEGKDIEGSWFNATAYAQAKWNKQRNPELPKVRKADFYEVMQVRLSPLPQWEHLALKERLKLAALLVDEVVAEAAKQRRVTGKKVLGRKLVMRASITRRVAPPKPPWWQERRRQIVAWAATKDALTNQYMELYWEFQALWRAACEVLKESAETVFPPGAWLPSQYKEQSA
jgi:REP element-mobilizing transposase RayT